MRWTEQRNFEAILELLSNGTLDFKKLISHRFSIDNAIEAYDSLKDSKALGILIDYPSNGITALKNNRLSLVKDELSASSLSKDNPRIGFIGAGNYASRTLIPSFKRSGAYLDTLISIGGSSALHHGKKNGFASVGSDLDHLLKEESINTIVIATRHNEHANQVIKGLEAKKNIFVEKPLALKIEEVEQIHEQYMRTNSNSSEDSSRLMIGFNRRFSPHIEKMKNFAT